MNSNVRKATEIALDDALVAEARALGLDVSDAAEEGLARAVKAEKDAAGRSRTPMRSGRSANMSRSMDCPSPGIVSSETVPGG